MNININLKLKERRDKINEILRHKRTKVIRKFKQAKREFNEENQNNPDESIKTKIEKYQNVEKMISNFNKKIGAYDEENNINNQSNQRQRQPSNRVEKKKQKYQEKNKNGNNEMNPSTSNEINNGNSKSKKFQKKWVDQKGEKKTPEEIQKEKEIKLQKRKKIYRNLHKKTPKGQPVMKFQVEHIFKKIKDKIHKGLI